MKIILNKRLKRVRFSDRNAEIIGISKCGILIRYKDNKENLSWKSSEKSFSQLNDILDEFYITKKDYLNQNNRYSFTQIEGLKSLKPDIISIKIN